MTSPRGGAGTPGKGWGRVKSARLRALVWAVIGLAWAVNVYVAYKGNHHDFTQAVSALLAAVTAAKLAAELLIAYAQRMGPRTKAALIGATLFTSRHDDGRRLHAVPCQDEPGANEGLSEAQSTLQSGLPSLLARARQEQLAREGRSPGHSGAG